jgi:hypothetical protein
MFNHHFWGFLEGYLTPSSSSTSLCSQASSIADDVEKPVEKREFLRSSSSVADMETLEKEAAAEKMKKRRHWLLDPERREKTISKALEDFEKGCAVDVRCPYPYQVITPADEQRTYVNEKGETCFTVPKPGTKLIRSTLAEDVDRNFGDTVYYYDCGKSVFGMPRRVRLTKREFQMLMPTSY